MKPFKAIFNFCMIVIFLALATTGLVKFPALKNFFNFIFLYIPASTISRIHDFSGIALILLIIIHLFLNLLKLPKRFLILILIAFIVIISSLLIVNFNAKNQPIKLNEIEVKDYNGERLDSINDFRENSIKGPQYIDKNNYNLEITGLAENTVNYSYEDVLKFQKYKKVVQLNCVEGWSVKILWEGILVKDLIKDLSIKPEAKTIIFYAVDGYSTSFPIEYVLDNDIIMAYKMNDVVLPPERGFPFQLVAEQKWGYKWIKWITKIEISDDINYQGYWEQRGYNNEGDLDGPNFR